MENTILKLKKIWTLLLILIVLTGAVCYFLMPDPTPFTQMQYYVKTIFLILILILIPATSINQSRVMKKSKDKDEEHRITLLYKAFSLKIIAIAFLNISGAILLLITGDDTYLKIIGLLLILIVVGYPSTGLITREINKE